MSHVYYNEIDPFCANWLRNLIAANLIAPGEVDTRSIIDVRAGDLRGFAQCHFFAGIAGWSYALRLAGWPDDRECWTGSCPCQPLSVAGQRKGHADERHLWPAFHRLVAERRPPVVFGEQVASKDGREWLAGVRADLEALGYACGAADLCAAGVGAPHVRQRLFWVADTPSGGRQQFALERPDSILTETNGERQLLESGNHGAGASFRLGYAASPRPQREWREYRPRGERHSGLAGLAMQTGVPQWNGETVAIKCADGARRISSESDAFPLAHGDKGRMGRLRAYGNAIVPQVAAEFIGAVMGCLP